MLFSFTKNSPKCLINASPISCLKTEFSSIFCFSSFFTYLFTQSLQIHGFQKDLEAFPVSKDEGVKVIYAYNNFSPMLSHMNTMAMDLRSAFSVSLCTPLFACSFITDLFIIDVIYPSQIKEIIK